MPVSTEAVTSATATVAGRGQPYNFLTIGRISASTGHPGQQHLATYGAEERA
jgi:hypothetical protein